MKSATDITQADRDALAPILREDRTAIARSTAQLLGHYGNQVDVEAVVDGFARILEENDKPRLRECLGGDLDAYDTARVLRITASVCVDSLRRHLPAEKARTIETFREAVRAHIPRQPVDPETFQFYEQLLEMPDDGLPDDQRRLVTIFHGTMAALDEMVYIHDTHGVMLYLNKRGMALAGFNRDDFYNGLSIYDLLTPESVEVVEERLSKVHAPSWSPLMVNVLTKAGARTPLEVTTRPLIENGVVTGVIGVGRPAPSADHTENTSASLPLLWQTAPIAVFVLNPEGVIQDANTAASRLAGANNTGSLTGRALDEVLSKPDEGRAALRDLLASPTRGTQEYKGTTAFGRRIAANVSIQSVRDGSGAKRYVFIQDITPREEIRQRLVRAEKLSALGKTMAGLSHELNNPLTGILGYTQIIMASDIPAAIRERVDYIAQEAQRAHRIVQSLLSFAQKRDAQMQAQDVNQVLKNTLRLREYQFRADGIDVETDFDPALPTVQMDTAAMQSVFLNILNNAQTAVRAVQDDRRKTVRIATSKNDGNVIIQVADNGVGIPQENVSKVFDPFFSTKEIGDGTGLGLSVSYGIVHNHDGEILIDSVEGEGTTLTVYLPADQD